MAPEDYLKAGNLKESLQLLQERIKKQPSNPADRIFLFQLLSVMGQWERAQTQLKVLKELDERSIPMVLTYRQVIACEQYREQVFSGQLLICFRSLQEGCIFVAQLIGCSWQNVVCKWCYTRRLSCLKGLSVSKG